MTIFASNDCIREQTTGSRVWSGVESQRIVCYWRGLCGRSDGGSATRIGFDKRKF